MFQNPARQRAATSAGLTYRNRDNVNAHPYAHDPAVRRRSSHDHGQRPPATPMYYSEAPRILEPDEQALFDFELACSQPALPSNNSAFESAPLSFVMPSPQQSHSAGLGLYNPRFDWRNIYSGSQTLGGFDTYSTYTSQGSLPPSESSNSVISSFSQDQVPFFAPEPPQQELYSRPPNSISYQEALPVDDNIQRPALIASSLPAPVTNESPANDPRPARKRRATTASVSRLDTPIIVCKAPPAPPKYAGNLDIYATTLPGLSEICLPANVTFPQFADLYDALVGYQAKSLHTGRCFLPRDSGENNSAAGRFRAACVYDPIADASFDVSLREFVHFSAFKFSSKVRNLFPGPACRPSGPGVQAKTGLQTHDNGVKSSTGIFKLKRVWFKSTPDTGALQELFEGYFSLRVSYHEAHKRKDTLPPQKFAIGFWAIRAARDHDGKEVGLVP